MRREKEREKLAYCVKWGKSPVHRPPPPRVYALYDKSDSNIMYDTPESISEHVGNFFVQLFWQYQEESTKMDLG